MEKLFILVFFLFVAVLIIKFFKFLSFDKNERKKRFKKKILYKYNKKDFLMTRPEGQFFNILKELLEDNYYIFTQVHLSTILDHKVRGQNWRGAFSHINSKSVDYVISDKFFRPLLVIELDDISHERKDRKKRDEIVENILENTGIPFLRIKNNSYHNKEDIKALISEKLKFKNIKKEGKRGYK